MMRNKRKFLTMLNWNFNEGAGDGAGDGDGTGGGGVGAGDAGSSMSADNWREFLPADIKDDPSISKYSTFEAFAKGHVNAVRMIGKDKIAMPETDEQFSELYSRLGRPDQADGYDLTAPEGTPDTSKFNQDFEGTLKTTMHSLGLTGKQAKGVTDFLYKTMTDSHQDNAAVDELMAQENEAALRKSYGQNVDAYIDASLQVVKELGGAEAAKAISREDLVNNPILVKIFSGIANKVLEDTGVKGGILSGTIADFDTQIRDLTSSNAYLDGKHPDHKRVVQQVFSLRERKAAAMDAA